MLKISKRVEPPCLAQTRNDYVKVHGPVTDDAWASLHGDCKRAMRETAYAEQGGLCAYCMSPLSGTHAADRGEPDKGGMTIEHFEARASAGHRTLDWDNLLGVCPGVVVGSEEAGLLHCDAARGHALLSHNPARVPPDVLDLYRYDAMGRMWSDDADATADVDVLQLNLARLKRNRKAVLDALHGALQRKAGLPELQRRLASYSARDANGRLLPYAGVGVWYLRRKLKSRGAR